MQTVEDLQASVSILENRLRSLSVNRSEDEISVFPDTSVALYHCLLGNAYYPLFQRLNSVNVLERKEIGKKCLSAFEASVTVASTCLEIFECQRLYALHSLCKALCHISGKFKKAKRIADKTFEAASLHTNGLDEHSLELLQRLRDDFMTYLPDTVNSGENQSVKSSKSKGMVSDVKNKVKAAAATQHNDSTAEEDEDVDEDENDGDIDALVTTTRKHKKSVVAAGDAPMKDVPPSNKGVELVRRMKRIVSLPVPVQLETIPSAALLLKALDRIFRAYVRGNALPGQMTGGNTVDLDGRNMTFRTFILHGPYMNWRGFHSFLLDFSIAKPPLPHTRSGKNYLSVMASSSKNGGSVVLNVAGPEPPLELKEAGAVFIESSHSATPALVLSKYLKLYEEIALGLTYEPWSVVSEWTEERGYGEWNITSGINFMQFVDCLGKLGAVAYSSSRFVDILPTFADKIEHFLTAYLGLTDERRWKARVDNKLKRIKNTINDLREKIKESAAREVMKNTAIHNAANHIVGGGNTHNVTHSSGGVNGSNSRSNSPVKHKTTS